jgi:hypothetical protein
MMTPHGTMPDDTTNHYGLGIRLVRNNGRLEIGHYGGGLGYGAIVRGLPDVGAGVILLTNQNATLLNATADSALAALAPASRTGDRQSSVVPASVRGPDARTLAGVYRNGPGQLFQLQVIGDSLVLEDNGDTLLIVRTGPRTLAALAEGAVAIEWTVVPSLSRPTFLFTLGRAFRREESRPR